MELKEFLKTLLPDARDKFAESCGTTPGHLRNVAYGLRTCAESLAIAVERESCGNVRCETMRPDVDWAYLRGTSNSPGAEPTTRKTG